MTAGDWRVLVAGALEEQACAIDDALVELENVRELLEARGKDELGGELRSLAGGLRAEASTMRDEARQLQLSKEPAPGFFEMPTTTRQVRRPDP